MSMEKEPLRRPSEAGYLALLRNRPFFLFFTAQIAASAGDGLFTTAAVFLALELGASPFEIGLIGFCASLPRIFLGPVGGVYADSRDRRRILIVANWLRFAAMLTIPVLGAFGFLGVGAIILITVLTVSCSTFFMPAAKAMIPEVAGKERIGLANGLLQSITWPVFLLGAGLVGPLQALLGFTHLFYANAAAYALSAVALHQLRIRAAGLPASSGPPALLVHMAEGYRTLTRVRPLHTVVRSYVLLTFFWRGLLQVGLSLVLADHPGGGAGLYGALMALNGAGEMVGSLVAGKVNFRRPLATAFLGEAVFGAGLLGMALSEKIGWLAVMMFLTGAAISFADVPTITVIQRRIPDRHVAKVFGYWNSVAAVGGTVGPLVMGWLFEWVPVSYGFVAGGTALVILGTVGAWRFARGRVRRDELWRSKAG